MIIPIRCFTCNKVLASLYKTYLERTKASNTNKVSELNDILITKSDNNKKIFDDLGLRRYCCRRHVLTHVDLIQKI